MNTNKKDILTRDKLLDTTIALRKKIKKNKRGRGAYDKLYIKLLGEIERTLEASPPSPEKLSKHAFGLGRLITDGDQDSRIGNELHTYLMVLYQFCDNFKEKQG